ncbi:hypothetical protein F4604DRAFT_550537 [Suillus subluteus]|nr:hypothetical protein F4604DRAFT_550537 [Suillus subluteus]
MILSTLRMAALLLPCKIVLCFILLLTHSLPFPLLWENTDTAQNLTMCPTSFGCNTTSLNASTPLLIYLANGGPSHNVEAPVTNTSMD